jgi:hypothetical protein
MVSFKQPLSIYFVWHRDDNSKVEEALNYCFNSLKRDSKRPFSRSLNLPVFSRTSLTNDVPSPIDADSINTFVFVFISARIVCNDKWTGYVEGLPSSETFHVIPIALDPTAFNMDGCLHGINAIRAFQFEDKFFKEQLLISVTHEIYRLSLNEQHKTLKLGSDTAIELFLSHAKDGKQGLRIAEKLKNFIDYTSMRNFFDATDIAPGYKFDSEIEGHIKNSTLIAIHSDPYSSRYWCQKEIQCAKKFNRPIIAVDSLEEFEDRRFPAASNVPGVHVHLNVDNEVDTEDLYRIVTSALLETVRFFYAQMLLKCYQDDGWFNPDSIILSRPPEMTDILKSKLTTASACKNFVYPEPPIYEEELEVFELLEFKAYTPLNAPNNQFKSRNVGISISELNNEQLVKIGHQNSHLENLAQDIARHFLSRKNILIYGGNLSDNGFTEFLFKEAQALQTRTNSKSIFVKNFISWPIYTNQTDKLNQWQAEYIKIARMEKVSPPENLVIDPETYISPEPTENKFIWSRSLSKMRYKMIDECDIRICAGGKSSQYLGRMPGVLEEILISIELEKPLFLLGGFGGMTKHICNLIEKNKIDAELTDRWQKEHTSGYAELLEYITQKNSSYFPEYGDLLTKKLLFSNLKNGLTNEENIKLFSTPFVDEAIHLIFKGIANLDPCKN